MDAIGPMEARLLGVERKVAYIERRARDNQRQLIALGQGIWDAWNDSSPGGASPPPPPPTQKISLCGGLNVLYSLPFADSIYGSGMLVWNGSTAWTACLSGLSYGGGFGCTAQTIALHYSLTPAGALTLGWASNGITTCPIASTCSTTVNVSGLTVVSTNCSSVPATATFTLSGSIQTIRFPHPSETITVQLLT